MRKNTRKFNFGPMILCLIAFHATLSSSFEMDSLGRVVRGHLGALYDLRSKLNGSPTTTQRAVAEPPAPLQSSNRRNSSPQRQQSQIKTEAPTTVRKESRGYAFHYSPSDVSNPLYSPSSSSLQDVQRPIKSSGGKWKKNGEGNWDKYVKRVQKKQPSTPVPVKEFHITPETTPSDQDPTPDTKITVFPALSPVPPTPTLSFPSFNVGPLKSFTQGLNSAMTAVLTQKLINIIDQDVPAGLLDPMRHVVASGNRMVEFWDKRTIARDGKTPGIVELMGYGLDQLKKFKDGQPLKSTDPVTSSTSPSKTLIQGMVTIKKLTNRVLGYDTDMEAIESRGGYGHDSYGGGGGYGHMSYGHYLDPYAILATLGFGVFLFNVIFNLLNQNTATSGRSLDVSDMDVPLALSDIIGGGDPNDKIFGTPTIRTKRGADYDDGTFSSIIDKLDGIFKTYNQVTEKPKCLRLYMCRLAVQDAMGDVNKVLSQVYMFGLQHYASDRSAKPFIQSIKDRVMAGEDVDCDKIVKDCIPSDLYNEEK